jgi:hypothetical protein
MTEGQEVNWHGALRAALAGVGVSDETLERLLTEKLGEAAEWLPDVLVGAEQPTLAQYVMISAVTDVNVPVLTGRVPPAGSAFVALRSQTLDTPRAAITDAQDRGLQLVQLSRLLNSWDEHGAARRERLERLRGVLNRHTNPVVAGQRTAGQLRRRLEKDGAVSEERPLVDLVGLIEGCGVAVEFTKKLPGGVHGLTVHDSSLGTWDGVILVSSRDYWVRQRYTLAHEFCHALFADSDNRFVNDDTTMLSAETIERRAEAFARHFLAPRRQLQRVWRESMDRSGRPEVALCEVMLHFGLSRQATLFALSNERVARANELSGLGSGTVSTLMARAGLRARWEAECEHQNETGASPLLMNAALELYGVGAVSAATVAGVLGRDEGEVIRDLAVNGWAPQPG